MKTKQFLLILLAFAGIAMACSDDEDEFIPYLKIEKLPSVITVNEQAQDTFLLLSTNVAWTATTADAWITLKSTAGIAADNYKFEFGMLANPEQAVRDGKVVLTAKEYPDKNITINIRQEGVKIIPAVVISEPTEKKLVLNNSGAGEYSFSVTSNVDWKVSTTDAWITLQAEEGTGDAVIKFGVIANTETEADKEGTITVSYAKDESVRDVLAVVHPKAINYQKRDSLAMLAILKNITFNNPYYTKNWKVEKPISEWNFVTVEKGRVTGIDFKEQVAGTLTLPEEIGDLTELKVLGLSYFGVTGPIPESMGKLTKLQILKLDNNRLEGEFPAFFENLKALTTLTLSKSKLTGCVPASLAGFLESINPQQGNGGWKDTYDLNVCE